MKQQSVVDRPILLVGCGRSGTTLLYQILCTHPDLAWFSTYTSRWPRLPHLATASRLYPTLRRLGVKRRGLPLPSEGYPIWDAIRPRLPGPTQGPLTENDLGEGERDRIEAVIVSHLRYQGKQRFINKNTRNVRRLRYLDALLPTSRFIHIIRDPRATVASHLKVAWWPDLPLWCFEGRTPRELVDSGHREEAVAAEVWRQDLEVAFMHKRHISPDRYLELRYEALIADPRATLQQALDFMGLTWTPHFERGVNGFSIRDSNAKYADQLTEAQIEEIERITGPTAVGLGYEVPAP